MLMRLLVRESICFYLVYIFICVFMLFLYFIFNAWKENSVRKSEETHERRRRSKTFYKVNKLDALFCIL